MAVYSSDTLVPVTAVVNGFGGDSHRDELKRIIIAHGSVFFLNERTHIFLAYCVLLAVWGGIQLPIPGVYMLFIHECVR